MRRKDSFKVPGFPGVGIAFLGICTPLCCSCSEPSRRPLPALRMRWTGRVAELLLYVVVAGTGLAVPLINMRIEFPRFLDVSALVKTHKKLAKVKRL